jgi:adenylate cyclase
LNIANPTGKERKLAAILAADVVGYSRMMSDHEERTLRILEDRMHSFERLVPEHGGRIFATGGDSVLAEFASAVAAMQCALSIRDDLARRNAEQPEAQMFFRMGVSVGDVVVDGDNLMGECVNIAARLEGICEPGSITLSSDVYGQVRNRVEANFDDLGEQTLKNIPHAVRAYKAVSKVSRGATDGLGQVRATLVHSDRRIVISIALLLVVAISFFAFRDELRHQPVDQSIPSVLVLPFANMNEDPGQSYFTDGISQDIITDLSRISNIRVLAWNTSENYKGKQVDTTKIRDDLQVAYVLAGQVRKSGDRVRINAQLVETGDGENVWAERYDRMVGEIFALQDDVTQSIVTALAIQLTPDDQEHLAHTRPQNFEAYDVFLRGQEYSSRRTREGNELAKDAFKRAVELDPSYGRAYGALAVALTRDLRNAWTDQNPDEVRARALELVERAVRLDNSSPQVYWAQGYVYLMLGKQHEAAEAAQRSTEIAPNYADGLGLLSLIENVQGDFDGAILHIRKAMDLNPFYSYEYDGNLGRAYFALGRYDEAIAAFLDALEKNENAQDPRLYLASCYVRVSRVDDARWEIEQIRVLRPDLTLTHLAGTMPIHPKHLDAFLDDLRTAGMPE